MSDLYLDRLARLLVNYSVAARPGERISISGPPAAEPLLARLQAAVLGAGAVASLRITPPNGVPLSSSHQLNPCDAAIFVETGSEEPLQGPAPLAGEARASAPSGVLRRAVARTMRWVVTMFPCATMARRAGMSLAEWQATIYASALLDQPDPGAAWAAVSERQQRLCDFLQGAREMRIITPLGTDLTLRVDRRTWVNADGHWNMPDGEVFTAPLEDATEGVLRVPTPVVFDGQVIEGIWLRFRAGRVVEATASRGQRLLEQLLEVDAGARVLGEVALGCNYTIPRLTGLTLVDEKVGGTFHVALGAAYPQSGGANRSALHWDVVCDLRDGGRVEVDGRLILRDGRFLRGDWPQL